MTAARHTRCKAGHIALLGAALVFGLSACITTGGSNGSGNGSSFAANDGAAGQRPATADNRKTAADSGQNDHAVIGRKKEVALATFEGDLSCTQLVAPYTLQDNVADLIELATNAGSRALSTWFDDWLNGAKGKAAADASLANARHNIPIEVRTMALRMNWLPMKAETMYGQMALEKWGDDLLPREGRAGQALYPKADAMLAGLLNGITETHDYKFVLHLSKRSGRNALALPGGLIVVDAELIKNDALRDKAQFALAHELAHVLQRHETRAVQARIIDAISLRAGVTDLIRSIRLVQNDPKPLIQLVLAGKQQFERHSEVQELHSDSCATRVVDRAVKSPPRLVAVLQAFVADLPKPASAPASEPGANKAPGQEARANLENLVELVSRPIDRHPSTKERIENLNRVLNTLKGNPKPATSKPAADAGKLDPKKVAVPKATSPATAP